MTTTALSEPSSPTPLNHDRFGRRRSTAVVPPAAISAAAVPAVPAVPAAVPAGSRPFVLSPPPTPRCPRPRGPSLNVRLRSNSGLSLHTNEEALRQYTDYNSDGSPRTPVFAPVLWRRDTLDSIETVSRTSMGGMYDDGIMPAFPGCDFLGRDVFRMVIGSPSTMERLSRFAESQGWGGDVEFLVRIQEYTRLLDRTAGQLADISTTFTAPGASTIVGLQTRTLRALDGDIKRLELALVPEFQNLFAEAWAAIEQRVVRTTYPAFVKRQLVLCASMSAPSLAAGPDSGERPDPPSYPGLGNAFCVSNPSIGEAPIVCASDGFLALTGYDWVEVFGRNGRFLQGAFTDREAVSRLREATQRREEVVELVLNYRKNLQPFWNLLYVCPLLDPAGNLQFYLGAQVDVTQAMATRKDVLRALSFAPPAAAENGFSSRAQSVREQPAGDRDPSLVGSSDSARGRTAREFLRHFRKKASGSCHAVSKPSSRQTNHTPEPTELVPPTPPPSPDLVCTAYGCFIVLQHIRPPAATAQAVASKSKARAAPTLSVSFCSRGALDTLGLGTATSAVVHKDVFTVLAEQASPPWEVKAVRTTVQDAVLGAGEPLRMELSASRGGSGAMRLRRSGSAGGSSGGDGGGADRNAAKRGGGLSIGIGIGMGMGMGRKGGSAATSETLLLTSYWTPLKNREGEVEWVVLVVDAGLPCHY